MNGDNLTRQAIQGHTVGEVLIAAYQRANIAEVKLARIAALCAQVALAEKTRGFATPFIDAIQSVLNEEN